MSSKSGWLVLFGALLVAVVLTNLIWSQEAKQDLGIRIVRVKNVYNDCQLKKQFQDELEAWSKDESKRLQILREEIENLWRAMQVIEESAPNFKELREQWSMKKALFDERANESKRKIQEMAAQNMQKLYKAIREAIDKYAIDHGLMLVLKFDDDDISDISPDMASSQINYRSVLHCESSLDITDEIMRALDAATQKGGSEK